MMTYKEISKLNHIYWCSTTKGGRAAYLKCLLRSRKRNIVVVRRWWGVYELYEIRN